MYGWVIISVLQLFDCNLSKSSSSSVDMSANIKSAVAGRPKDSDVSSRPISLDTKPDLVVCVADIIGTFVSTARPRSYSAIDLTKV